MSRYAHDIQNSAKQNSLPRMTVGDGQWTMMEKASRALIDAVMRSLSGLIAEKLVESSSMTSAMTMS